MLQRTFVQAKPIKALSRWTVRTARMVSSMGKIVIITGASSGIGKELSLQYAKQGARLVLSARRMDKLREVKSLCDAAGAGVTLIVECDVSKDQDCKGLIATSIKEFGSIDTMILNAGIGQVHCYDTTYMYTTYLCITAARCYLVLFSGNHEPRFQLKAVHGHQLLWVCISYRGGVAPPAKNQWPHRRRFIPRWVDAISSSNLV